MKLKSKKGTLSKISPCPLSGQLQVQMAHPGTFPWRPQGHLQRSCPNRTLTVSLSLAPPPGLPAQCTAPPHPHWPKPSAVESPVPTSHLSVLGFSLQNTPSSGRGSLSPTHRPGPGLSSSTDPARRALRRTPTEELARGTPLPGAHPWPPPELKVKLQLPLHGPQDTTAPASRLLGPCCALFTIRCQLQCHLFQVTVPSPVIN